MLLSSRSGRIIISKYGDSVPFPRRKTSRNRRLILFLATAFPCFRETSTANLSPTCSLGRYIIEKPFRRERLPDRSKKEISLLFFIRWSLLKPWAFLTSKRLYSSETVSRFRPFARLRERTSRPFRSAIRFLNPCLFALFLFDG